MQSVSIVASLCCTLDGRVRSTRSLDKSPSTQLAPRFVSPSRPQLAAWWQLVSPVSSVSYLKARPRGALLQRAVQHSSRCSAGEPRVRVYLRNVNLATRHLILAA